MDARLFPEAWKKRKTHDRFQQPSSIPSRLCVLPSKQRTLRRFLNPRVSHQSGFSHHLMMGKSLHFCIILDSTKSLFDYPWVSLSPSLLSKYSANGPAFLHHFSKYSATDHAFVVAPTNLEAPSNYGRHDHNNPQCLI